MESTQAPHQQLEEQEIKDLVSLLSVQVRELREEINSELDDIESKLYKLKRHFCPEKFQQVKVPMETISEIIMHTYGDINLGEKMKMERPSEDQK